MVSHMHAGRRPAEGGDERHLIQLFSGNLQRRIRRIAVRALHVHFCFRNRLATCQRLEAIELPLGQRRCRLSVVNPLLGFTGVQSGKLLPLFDGCTLTNIERFNLTCALEGKVCCITRFNAGGKTRCWA
jgi:hypothetical protein